jgi:hypothetical protein
VRPRALRSHLSLRQQPQLRPPNKNFPPLYHPPQPSTLPTLSPTDLQAETLASIQEEERFYDTEIEEELELPSTSQISCTKKLKDDPPEGEFNSKKPRKTQPLTFK